MNPCPQIPSQYEKKFEELIRVFLEVNANINLSALRTEELCRVGNVQDSLSFELWLATQSVKPKNLLDIGTGGGFPLLPIALMHPEIECTGMDSIGKKCKAIEEIAKKSCIDNVHTIADRAEPRADLKGYRDSFDIVTARAVAALPTLLEWCAPFVKPNGTLILWKSIHLEDELHHAPEILKKLNLSPFEIIKYDLPLDFGTRQLLITKKLGPCPREFPRTIGLAKTNPLFH